MVGDGRWRNLCSGLSTFSSLTALCPYSFVQKHTEESTYGLYGQFPQRRPLRNQFPAPLHQTPPLSTEWPHTGTAPAITHIHAHTQTCTTHTFTHSSIYTPTHPYIDTQRQAPTQTPSLPVPQLLVPLVGSGCPLLASMVAASGKKPVPPSPAPPHSSSGAGAAALTVLLGTQTNDHETSDLNPHELESEQ